MATVFDVVLKDIGARRDAVTQALVGGAAKDYADYKYLTGELRGLALAEGYIRDLVRHMEETDE